MVEARKVCQEISNSGKIPFVVGGTGLYLKALLEGIFEGPGRSQDIRERLNRIGARKGFDYLYRLLERKDPAAAGRIEAGDQVRIVRSLEIWGDGSDGGLTDNPVSAADDRGSLDHGMRANLRSLSYGDAITDDGIGPDSNSFTDFSTRRNNGGFVDFTALFLPHVSYSSEAGRSTSENKISASATR